MIAASPYTIRLAIPALATYRQLRVAAGLSAKTTEAAAKGLPNSLFAVQVLYGDAVVGMGTVIGDGQAQALYAQFGFQHTAPASVGMALKR